MESFETDAAILAAHSTFNSEDWTVETAFARGDNFLDREEALLSSDEDDGCSDGDVEMEFEGDAKGELISTLRDRDDDIKSVNSRGSAASRRTAFSSSTGNSSVRTANTAKLARDLKENTLGLAKANLNNADLQRKANEASLAKGELEKETARLRQKQEDSDRREADLLKRLQAMEAMFAGGMGQGNSGAPSALPAAASTKMNENEQALNLGTNTPDENEGPRSA